MSETDAGVLLALLCCALAAPAHAQTAAADTGGTEEEMLNDERIMVPGTIDSQLTVGGGPLLSIQAEPAVDIGILPIGEVLTVSLGAGIGASYCVGCFIFEILTLRVRYWSVEPMVRALVHLRGLSQWAEVPKIDLYAGALGGAGWYNFSLATRVGADIDASVNELAFGIGGLAGVHYLFTPNLFVGAEARYLRWLGVSSEQITVEGETRAFNYGDFIRSGTDYTFHFGVRF